MGDAVEISVVVPTRDRAAYLEECLDALAAQTCPAPFEVVVVDNASTDRTPQVVRARAERDPRFRGIVEPRLGLSAAKNAGARAARGALLLFADDDVIVGPAWVEAYHRLYSGHGDDQGLLLAGGPITPIPADRGDWPSWFPGAAVTDVGVLDLGAERALDELEFVWGANMAIPARCLAAVGGFDEAVGRRGDHRGTYEDIELQQRVRQQGGTVWFCPSATLEHRVDPGSLSPRQLLRSAFARGRLDHLHATREAAPGRRGGGARPVRLAGLVVRLGAWLAWAACFRAVRWRAAFARAHAASHGAGRALDAVREGHHHARSSRLAERLTSTILRLASAVTPDR